jgi:uncharacterized protein (DUF1330 family)
MKFDLAGPWRPLLGLLALGLLAPPALAQSASQPVAAPAAQPSAQAPSTDGSRPGYLLVMGNVTDREALARYGATLGPIYAQHGGRPIAIGAVGRNVRVLEGQFPFQSIVLSRFPSIDAPNAFWWSPEYRRSVELRRGAGSFTVLRLKGMAGDAVAPSSKPAYLISIAEIRDRDKLKLYAAAAVPLVQAAGAKFISAGGRKDIELLEGEFGNRTVNVLRFPSLEALRRFYEDPAYQKVIPTRQSAGDYTLLEVDAG